MSFIDKLAWVCIDDRKLLNARSKGKDIWYIPGGKREAGESDEQALVREIFEEMSVRLNAEKLTYVTTVEAQAHGKPEGVMVRLTCYSGPYTGTLKAAAEIEEIGWLTSADKDRISATSKLLFEWLKQENMMD